MAREITMTFKEVLLTLSCNPNDGKATKIVNLISEIENMVELCLNRGHAYNLFFYKT